MSRLARTPYTLASSTRVCAATGRPLTTGEPFVAALVPAGEPGNEHFERLDFSLEAWKSGARPQTADSKRRAVLGSWRGTVAEPGAKKRILIDDESLLDLFEQSAEPGELEAQTADMGAAAAASDDRRAFRFLLALILIRKRLLICEKTDARATMFLRARGTPKPGEGGLLTEVEDPGLSEHSIARIAGQLSAVLDGEAAPGSAAPLTTSPVVEIKP